jgi:hypothetical protein
VSWVARGSWNVKNLEIDYDLMIKSEFNRFRLLKEILNHWLAREGSGGRSVRRFEGNFGSVMEWKKDLGELVGFRRESG